MDDQDFQKKKEEWMETRINALKTLAMILFGFSVLEFIVILTILSIK